MLIEMTKFSPVGGGCFAPISPTPADIAKSEIPSTTGNTIGAKVKQLQPVLGVIMKTNSAKRIKTHWWAELLTI